MRYTTYHSNTHGNWYYRSKAGDNRGVEFTCRYVHERQEATFSACEDDRFGGINVAHTCSYHDLVNKTGKYKDFKGYVERDFSKKVFKELIGYVTPHYKPELVKAASGEAAGEDADNTESAEHQVNFIIHERVVHPHEEEENVQLGGGEDDNPLRHLKPNNEQDWTKTGDSLESFTWQSLRNAKFGKVPIFVRVILYPFIGLMFFFGSISSADAIQKGRFFIVFIGLLCIAIGLLLLFGIADYWTRKKQRIEDPNLYQINGKTLWGYLADQLGDKVHRGHHNKASMIEKYQHLLKASGVYKELVYRDEKFKVGYAEVLYISSSGTKKYTYDSSCFLLKLDKPVEKGYVYGQKNVNAWLKKNTGLVIENYLNTKGFFISADDNYVLLVFKEVLYRSQYVADVFQALVLAMDDKYNK